MGNESRAADESRLMAALRAAGISGAALERAKDTASRLGAGSAPLEGGTLDPRSGLEYQQLIAGLARKARR